MDPCPPRIQEDFTDGLQAGLVLALRQLAGEGGLAYLLREHEYFPGVFFPVASSWSPRAVDVEGQMSMHLSNYACLAYVFSGEEKTQQMSATFLDVVREWRIEALFLSQDRFDCVEQRAEQIWVDGDPWTRRIYDLEPGPGDDAHYRLVIGGPLAPTGVLTTPLRKTMERMILETWPVVTRRNLIAIDEKDQLIAQLADYFGDQSPAPPYTNAPVFEIWADGETRYGLNQLAFNCFLAHQIAKFSQHPVPQVDVLKRIDESFRADIAPQARDFWSDTLARTPHVLKMLDRASKRERRPYLDDKYTDYGKEILDAITRRTPLSHGIVTSRVLDLLSRFCDDQVTCIEGPESSDQGEWIFWIRANHLRHIDRHPPKKILDYQRGSADGQPASLRSFKKLWDVSVPGSCDLLNALWGVYLIDDRPELLVPLFMRFSQQGREYFFRQFATEKANSETDEQWVNPDLIIAEPDARPRIKLGIWLERIEPDDPELERRIKEGSKPILEDAARAPALKKTPADVLFDDLRIRKPFAAHVGELGHDWRGDSLQIQKTSTYLAMFYKLLIGSDRQFLGPLFAAMRHFWEPLESHRTLYINPLSLLLVFRLAELSSLEPSDFHPFAEWLNSLCPSLVDRENGLQNSPLICIGKRRSTVPWWMEMVSFVEMIRLHKTTLKPLFSMITLLGGEQSFSLRLRLEGFNHTKFVEHIEGKEEKGATTSQYLRLLTALDLDPMSSLVQPTAFPPGLGVYLVSAGDGAAELIVVAQDGIR